MNMEKSKIQYVSPKMEVNTVALEGNIAVQSPISNINVQAWENEEVVTPDTGDIYLPI